MITQVVFAQFGIQDVRMNGLERDPTTEEEFNIITYDSDVRVTWEQFLSTFNSIRNSSMVFALRNFRDQELRETDWVLTYDNVQTLENLEEWIQYRQYLRDLPSLNIEYVFNNESLPDLASMTIVSRPQVVRKKNNNS